MAIPTTRDEAIDDGKLQQYAHLYDVADEGRQRAAADEVIDTDLQAHKGALANRNPRKYGHLTGQVNVGIERPDEYTSDALAQPFRIDDGKITVMGAGNALKSASYDKPVLSPGIVYPGTGVQIDPEYRGKLDLKPATSSEIGGVKPSDSIAVDADGTAKVSDGIFGEPLTVEDGKVTVKHDETLKVGDDGALGVANVGSDVNIIAPLNAVSTPPTAVNKIGAVAIGDNAKSIDADAIAIGHEATAQSTHSVAIGDDCTAFKFGIAIGYNSRAVGDSSVAIGSYSNTTPSEGSCVSFGNSNLGTSRRLIRVSDPVNDSDAATKKYVDSHVVSQLASDAQYGLVRFGDYLKTGDNEGTATLDLASLVRQIAGSGLAAGTDYLNVNYNLIPNIITGTGLKEETSGSTNKIAVDSLAIAGNGLKSVADDRLDVDYGDYLRIDDNAALTIDLKALGPALAGDALYYDSTYGLMVKVSDGLEIQNDAIAIDQDKLPLASATNRGAVKVGSGLAIAADGTLSATGGSASVKIGDVVHVTGVVDSAVNAALGLNSAYLDAVGVANATQAGYIVNTTYIAARFTTRVAFTAGTTLKLGFESFATDDGGFEAVELAGFVGWPHIDLEAKTAVGTVNDELLPTNVQQGDEVETADGETHTIMAFNYKVREDIPAGTTFYCRLLSD